MSHTPKRDTTICHIHKTETQQYITYIKQDLRTISKTAWLSKCMENILGSFILPVINEYLDPGQCGGLKKTSITHYLVKLLDFVNSTLDSRTPHCAVLCTEDLSKAYR